MLCGGGMMVKACSGSSQLLWAGKFGRKFHGIRHHSLFSWFHLRFFLLLRRNCTFFSFTTSSLSRASVIKEEMLPHVDDLILERNEKAEQLRGQTESNESSGQQEVRKTRIWWLKV
jgi:hypothetical protein